VKHLIVPLLSLFLLGYSSDNSLFRVSQPAPGPETGVLEKLIVANGTVSLELDVNRLNGIRSRSQIQSLQFNVAPDSFLTSIAFNNEFRGLQSGSMTILPQENSAKAPAYLKNSLIIESSSWGQPYELTVRDEKTGALLFNIESHEFDYAGDKHSLVIKNGKLLLSKEFAQKLRRPSDEGAIVGTISIAASLKAIEIRQVVNGQTQSSVMPAAGQDGLTRVNGPDVIVGLLSGLAQFGNSSGTQVGLAVGTDSCNLGSVPLNWFASPNNDHPVIPQNLYRMSGGAANDERFEQIGQSNVKHAFFALQENICGLNCSATASNRLGAGCSDPYDASLNAGTNNGLGSRAWINPFTGAFPRGDSPTPPNSHIGHSHTGPSHRVLVEMNDLNTTMNAGATYYVEAQYVTPHEYAWCQANPGECNMANNASYRRYNVSGTTSFTFTPAAATVREQAAISAWPGATIIKIEPDPGNDGFGFIAYKVTNPSPGIWHYEYAIYNQNLDRAIQSFGLPISASTSLTNIGFHAPPQHPGWTNDGTVGNAGYSSAPWAPNRGANDLTWTTETFAENPNANAIRWGTLYNYRFDSDRPPQTTNATIGFYKTGASIQVAVQGPSLQSVLSINDVTVTEGNAGTVTANFTVSLQPSSTDPVSVQFATANGLASAGSDYVANSGTVNFAPGEVSKPVSITVNGDTLEEFNETFFVNLTNPTNAMIGDAQGVGTINNDEFLASLLSGFDQSQINGLSNPTAMAVHPDGRVFVCQQTGQLRVIKDGVVLPTPFTTLTVNASGERGLLGVAFDPNYATNRFVYVYYTATTPTIHNRVSRFTADAANEDIAVPGSEVVLLDLETLSATNHNGGAIHFGPDGKLYIATGENAVPSNAQSLSNRLGKILRINSDGTIPADNPTTFPNIAGSPTGVNRAIWAVGLRNPFTFTFQQGTGRMHINDVGQNTWEEINLGAPGANYGWPACEGQCAAAGMTNPVYAYSSASGPNCAITGGAFYSPTTNTFPAQYIGKYFFADFCGGWLRTIDPLNPPPINGSAPDFATGISLPVDIQVANDGSLYYLARGANSVFRVQYFGGPTIAIDNVTVTEGNSGTTTANFNVLLSPASSQTVTVQYATAPGSAAAGSDYSTSSGTVTFAPGQTSQPVSVLVLGDTAFEPNETFNVNLSNPTNATLGDDQGVGTIIDDDNPPTISVNDVTITEGNSGTKTAVFTIALSNPHSQNVSVIFATSDDAATAGSDYVATNGVATITAGLPSTSIAVTINGDTTFEGDENFRFELSSPTNATITDNLGMGIISNDDPVPTVSINDVSVTEGNSGTTNAAFTVSLSNPSNGTISVDYTTGNSTATAGSDFVAALATVVFSPGQTSRPVNITVNGDAVFELDETFNVNLISVTGATISDTQGVGTINNDDSQPAISINDVTVTEGNSGTTTATFTVALSNASNEVVSASYTTANGSASAGSDYVAASGSVSFAPGETSKPISVSVSGDTTFEGNETFNVNLSAPVNATIADNQGVGTITNDDAQPSISINNAALNEGNSGTSSAAFNVTLSNASTQTITVNFSTANGSATAGTDYVAASGSVSFAAGETSKSINVTVNGDTIFEPNETFNVNLSGAANATIADNQGVGTINNDDAQPSISINNASVNEGNSGTSSAAFTVTLSNASSQTITVNFSTANSSATAGTDYVAASGSVTFTPGTLTRPINVTVNGDSIFEVNETFNLNLSGAANATIADNQGVGTINNDDTQPSISINNASLSEGNSGTSSAAFTVTLSNASSQTITVNFSTANGSATAGTDYVAASGSVSFAAGETSKSINVTVNGDTTLESNESFNVNLSGAVNATIADNQGVGTINNDDGLPSISINNVSLNEGNSGTSSAAFTVTLSNASSQTVTVNFSTANGSATAGTDYVAASGSLSFAAGETSKSISVTVNGDTTFEPNETFNVNLSGAANATIADNQGVGTISNDDTQPTISIDDVSVNEGNTATSTASFIVSLTNASSQTITVNFATANNTAIAGTHYVARNGTVTFAPGQVSQPVNITINGDLLTEPPSVTFNVNLSTPTNATIADNQGAGTITDDDAPVLATGQNSQRAIALEAVTFVREPFSLTNPFFGTDQRTRIMLVATNLTGSPTVTARAVDSLLTNHDLTVEFVGPLPGVPEFRQIVVRLPETILLAGDLQVTIRVHDKTSNVVLIGVRP
jgi:glucose/arabinose dehydrogenase